MPQAATQRCTEGVAPEQDWNMRPVVDGAKNDVCRLAGLRAARHGRACARRMVRIGLPMVCVLMTLVGEPRPARIGQWGIATCFRHACSVQRLLSREVRSNSCRMAKGLARDSCK
jgi:hypothetical protein